MHLPYIDKTTGQLQSSHVVLLGAGASRASFPEGDKNGKKVPLMNELVSVLELSNEIHKNGLTEYEHDFERLYSIIFEDNRLNKLKEIIDETIRDYFSALVIPDEVTLYDYLILSLKDKDIIATFNWDPFLLQAYRRNIGVGNLPKLAFLHGNVFLGACTDDKALGYLDCICTKCQKKLSPVELLYPVTHKDYNKNEIIMSQWDMLSHNLDIAYFLTIWGYSAPKSDIEAIKIMNQAWKNNGNVNLAEIEVIDIKKEEEVRESWKDFTIREHYGIMKSLRESWLWQFPRESGEALYDATLQSDPIEPHPFPVTKDLATLQKFAKNIVIRELK